ncbi:unnamed protein product [Rhodiola kirilowii]
MWAYRENIQPSLSSAVSSSLLFDIKMDSNSSFGKRGGFRACISVYALGALENMGFVANMTSMVLYFAEVLFFDISTSSNTLTNFMGSTFILAMVGGFVADHTNKLYACLIFGFIELLGLMMVTVQAYSEKLHPEYCGTGKSSCIKGGQALMFYSSLCLLALGSGGVKGSLPVLGADQFNHKEENGKKALASYFNWYILCSTVGGTVGVTVIVWVSMNEAWYWGFLIGMITAFFGFILLAAGRPFYIFQALGDSPIMKIVQVIVAAFKNRSLSLPANHEELYEVNDKDRDSDGEKILHTDQFRLLDKAALPNGGTNLDPWRVCTVTQVEKAKIIIRMMPIVGSTIIMNTCLAQLQTFSVHQGFFMDPHVGSKKIPTASIPVIPMIFMVFFIPLYQFVFVPMARKVTGHPNGISQLQRVGVGLVLSIISMGIAGLVEVKRRDESIKNPFKPISVFWLSFQYGVFGIADMFTIVGLMEFFYKEAPAGMRSIATSFTWLSLSIGYFLSTVFVDMVNAVTKKARSDKRGWLEGNNLNTLNLDYFYWFLAVLSTLNFINYLYWSSWYKCKKDAATHENGLKGKDASI